MFHWLPRPSLDEMLDGLKQWEGPSDGALHLEEAGRSTENRPIPAVYITDPDVDPEHKQHVLFTTCHVGSETNACTGLLHFIKWLISDAPDAMRYRENYLMAVMPCVDPDHYEQHPPQRNPGNPYKDWTWEGPGDLPESRAVFKLMEELQPDAHVDVHGGPLKEFTMWESTGISWGASLSRCYEPELPRFIDDFVEDRGYLITRGEHDDGQLLSTAEVPGAGEHFYLQKSTKNATCISYHRYHTLGFIIEAGFEESIVLRARALLEAGLRRWRYQRTPQLPCDHVGIWTSTQLAAWGRTPAERRKSRVELWRRCARTGIGAAHPEDRGTIGSVVTFTPKGARQLGQPQPEDLAWRTKDITEIIETLEEDDQFNVPGLRSWLDNRPRLPENCAWNDGIAMRGPKKLDADIQPPAHGAVIRMLIPYRDAEVQEVALDGHPLERSDTDGYTISRNPGCVVHVSIPPGKVNDMHIATCIYDGRAARKSGFTSDDWAMP
jgi:hypothetical protein